MLFKTLVFTICLVATQSSFAQIEEAKSAFPDEDVLYGEYHKTLTIQKTTGEPTAVSKYDIDIIMLTDKINNMVNNYTVYHSGFNQLTNLNAYSKIPAGKKYKSVKVTEQKTTNSSSSSIFYDDSKETQVHFPALTQHAIAHLDYNLLHKDAHLITPFHAPAGMPTMNLSYSVIVPDGIDIRYLVKNDPENAFVFTKTKQGKATLYKWEIKNYKPIERYGNAPDFRYFNPHVIVHITGFQSDKGYVRFLSNLDDLYKWNFAFTKDINVKPDPAIKSLVDSLTNGVEDKFTKASLIYRWVQEHIRYIAFEDGLQGFIPRQATDIYQKRYGDCKDMSSMLVQMLRDAGLKAYFTWIGTRDIPYQYNDVPLPIVDNHMIAAMELDGKWYFLDATNSYSDLLLPPSAIQGKEALIGIDENNYKIVVVPIADAEKNMIVDSTFIKLNDKGITGFQKVDYFGYFGLDVLTSIKYRNEKDKEKYVKSRMGKGSNKFMLGKFTINNNYPASKDANISAEFEIPDYSKKIGDEYYINLNLEKLMDHNSLFPEKRKIPFENEFKYHILQHHILEIPENYKVSHIPEDLAFENDIVFIQIKYKLHENSIIATQEIRSKKLMLFPEDFEKWNEPIKLTIPKNKESVVLKPIK